MDSFGLKVAGGDFLPFRANCKTPWARGYSGLAVRVDKGFCKFALGQTAEWP